MSEDWRKLAAAASREKDPEKLQFLIHSLIRVFGEQQKQFRDEIDARIKRHVQDVGTNTLGTIPSRKNPSTH